MPQPLAVGWVGGADTFTTLGGALKPAGVGLVMDELVSLTALCPRGADPRDLPGAPVDVIEYALPWGWRLRTGALGPLADEIHKREIRLLHALDESAAALTCALAERARVGYVVSVYGIALGRAAAAVGQAAAVLPAGQAVRAELLARGICGDERMRPIALGLRQAKQATCFREPRYDISIVAGGRMDDFAAFAAVLRSFAELHERKYACAFFLMGNGRAEKALRAYADKLGLRRVLQFVDRQSPGHLAAILTAADLYITPAATEAVDVPALHAMAAGVPVIAAHGALGDFLVEGQTAMFFQPGDSDELTIKLVSLVDDRAAARDLAEKALAALGEPYTPTRMVASLVAVYRGVAGDATG